MKRIAAAAACLAGALLILTLSGSGRKVAAGLDEGAAEREKTAGSDSGVWFADDIPPLAESGEEDGTASLALEVLNLVNAERTKAGLSALSWSTGLERDAQIRVRECETSFSHTRPDGTAWWTVDSLLMYGENLAYNYDDAGSVMNAWLNSEGHRRNILKPGYTIIGVAAFEDSAGNLLWAQEFGY